MGFLRLFPGNTAELIEVVFCYYPGLFTVGRFSVGVQCSISVIRLINS